MSHDELSGAVNVASPNPLPYSDFMRDLRHAMHVPIGLPATRWMLAMGAWAMRSETELVLKSRRVIPTRLLQSGFTFQYPEWPAAVLELVKRRA
jgi:NAD dependent epimerase/dehydratase family enzyme